MVGCWVRALNEAFLKAIAENKFRGVYRGVFPIKVNQLREVVDEIVAAGKDFNYGLEAGSKPELMIALAMHEGNQRLIICNGYKDHDYMRLALLGRKLGKRIIIVIEQLSEVDSIIEISRETGVKPLIGFRVKLQTRGEGKWSSSTGDNAKFGLNTAEILFACEKLRAAKLTSCLRLVHFHIGSQVPNIITIKNAVIEATRFYCQLSKMGFPMGYLDVGGVRTRYLQAGDRDKPALVLLHGSGDEAIEFVYKAEGTGGRTRSVKRRHPFEGILPNFERRFRETDSAAVREDLVRYQSAKPCPDCEGTRLRREARNVFLVDGRAGEAMADLFVDRWKASGGDPVDRPDRPDETPWPDGLLPDLRRLPVAVARTSAAWQQRPEIIECLLLHLSAIQRAKRLIYLENQYLTSPIIVEALAERLAEPDGPEVVTVGPARVLGAVLQVAGPQGLRHVGHAHRGARVTGVSLLDGIHGKRTDGVGHGSDVLGGVGHGWWGSSWDKTAILASEPPRATPNGHLARHRCAPV